MNFKSVKWLSGASFAVVAAAIAAPVPALAISFNYDSFGQANDATLNRVGSAAYAEDALRLTSSGGEWQAGAVWHQAQVPVSNGFETSFQFQITDLRNSVNSNGIIPSDASNLFGGDGFAFVIQNNNANAIGYAGGALGYSGIGNLLAIEFDTWDNTNDFAQWGDETLDDLSLETSNHISIQGNQTGGFGEYPRFSLGFTDDIANLSDGNVHTAKIRYQSGALSVFLNGIQVLNETVDLGDFVQSNEAWVGFTASTGGSWENHDILSWSYTNEFDPQEAPEPSAILSLLGISSFSGLMLRRRRFC